MTQQEASEHYKIPVSILKEYESWGLCGAVKTVMGAWQYDDEDLQRLGSREKTASVQKLVDGLKP